MKRREGLTLVEVIVAMAVFAILSVLIFPAIAKLSLLNSQSKEVLTATFVAQQEAEKISHFSSQPPTSPAQDTIDFLIDQQGYACVGTCATKEPNENNTYTKTIDTFDIESFVYEVNSGDGTVATNLQRVVIVVKNHNGSDRSELEMVVRFNGQSS